MAVWGISLLILSLTFFTYRHPPHTWRFSIQQWLKKELQDSRVEKVGDDKGPAPVRNGKGFREEKEEEEEEEESVKEREESKEKQTPQGNEKELNESQDEDEDKTPQAKPTKPSIPVPSFTLDDDPSSTSTPSFTIDEPSTSTPSFPQKPSFPALNSPQRASSGTNTTPNPSTKPQTPSLMAPPSKPASQMLPPSKPTSTFPAPNSAQRASNSLMPPPRGPAPRPTSSLMPPPRGPIPNRGPPTSISTLNPPPRIDTPASRKKVQLLPGFSPLDWAHLSRQNLSNVPGFTRVTPSALATHNGRHGKDAWSAYRGKVYNITPYAGFHPGGKGELYRGAGKEATTMFMEVHPWVNWEGMLGNCLVGVLVPEGDAEEEEGLEGLD